MGSGEGTNTQKTETAFKNLMIPKKIYKWDQGRGLTHKKLRLLDKAPTILCFCVLVL